MPRVWADTTPGRITELLANEQDPVTVGQDLFRFEPGTVDEAASTTTHFDVFGLGKSHSEAVVS